MLDPSWFASTLTLPSADQSAIPECSLAEAEAETPETRDILLLRARDLRLLLALEEYLSSNDTDVVIAASHAIR